MMEAPVSWAALWSPTAAFLPPSPPGRVTLSSDAFLHASRVLAKLDVPANCLGYAQTAAALALASQDPQRLQLVSKWLYPEVAVIFCTGPTCVERNIRSVRTMVWEHSRNSLFALIGHPLARRPGNARFLAYLVACLIAGDRRLKNHNPEDAEPL